MAGAKKRPTGKKPAGRPGLPPTNEREGDSTPGDPEGETLLLAALNYARHGFRVFPCEPQGKGPCHRLVANGHRDATTNLKRIRQWWSAVPNANIGLVPPEGFAVLDVDPRNGGTETLEELLPNPDTLTARTGGGGRHLFYKDAPADLPGKLGPGIDLKRHGRGYVVAAPSLHESGRRYRWLRNVFDPQLIRPWPKSLKVAQREDSSPAEEHTLTPSQVRALLKKISSDEYETWVAVGQALKHDNPDWFTAWNAWSKTSDKYPGEDEALRKWNSFKGKGRSLGTLVYLAGGKIDRAAPEEEFAAVPEGEREKPKAKFAFKHISEIVAEQREPRWLLPDVLEAHVLAVLAGPRSSFKSFIALDWAMRIAIAGTGVLILSGEGAGLDRRVDAWVRTHEPTLDLPALPMVALERAINLNETAVVADLVQAIKAANIEIHLIVVDTLSKYSPGADENDNTEMAQYLSRLAVKIRDALDMTVLLVAHSGHSDPNRPRGASVLMANPDAEYIVHRPDPVGMFVSVSRNRFKDTPSLAPLNYMAEIIDLGRVDSRLQAVTSLALHAASSPETSSRRMPQGKVQRKAFEVLLDLDKLADGVVDLESWISEGVKSLVPPVNGKADKRRDYMRRAVQNLVDDGFIRLIGDTGVSVA